MLSRPTRTTATTATPSSRLLAVSVGTSVYMLDVSLVLSTLPAQFRLLSSMQQESGTVFSLLYSGFSAQSRYELTPQHSIYLS